MTAITNSLNTIPRSQGRKIAAVCALLVSVHAASAQPQLTLKVGPAGSVPNLTRVAVPPVSSMALSETRGLLAFAHDRSYTGSHLSLVKLDTKGNPAPYHTAWKLPQAPDKLAKLGVYALSVALHPKLPLLYVWQDVHVNYAVPIESHPPELKQFDHLLIYSTAKETPELLVSLCRGEVAHYGVAGGTLAVDPAGEYLYVPNLRDKNAWGHVGRYRLDPDGLPVVDGADLKLPVAARLKKLAERNAASGAAPAQQTPFEYQYIFPGGPWGVGHSFHFVAKDAIVMGGQNSLITWRPDDPQATVHSLPLKASGNTLISAHPTLPYLFATATNTDSFYRVAHAEGYLSLLPLQLTLADTRLYSPPAVFDKGTRVAVGGHYHVYFVSLDDKGNPRPEVTKVPVLSPAVRALTYSAKFDRLYVAVEVSK